MEYKTIATIKKYEALCGIDREPTDEERNFIEFLPLHLAESIMHDFEHNENGISVKVAKIILSCVE